MELEAGAKVAGEAFGLGDNSRGKHARVCTWDVQPDQQTRTAACCFFVFCFFRGGWSFYFLLFLFFKPIV